MTPKRVSLQDTEKTGSGHVGYSSLLQTEAAQSASAAGTGSGFLIPTLRSLRHCGCRVMPTWRTAVSGLVLLCSLLNMKVFAAAHQYVVTVNSALDAVDVEARPARAGVWLASSRGGSRRLASVAGCADEPVQRRNGAMRTTGDCLRYTASIESPVTGDGRRPRWPHAGHDHWLWLPELAEGDVVRLTLHLPPGVAAFLPWRQVGPSDYELRPSPGSGEAVAWFGPLRHSTLQLGKQSLALSILEPSLDQARMTRWLEEAANLVARVGGTFPNPHARVIVERGEVSPFGDSVVPFGQVLRSGEEVVRFFVKPGASLEALRYDWTAVHEFSHLLLPYVREDQKWISEGFASYYQNVLLARGGMYSEEEAWRRLTRSFGMAAATRDPVSPNGTAARSFWDVRMLVYWSGAALALMMDVDLRQQTGGRQSLDTVLGQLAACCLPSTSTWEGRALFERLDDLSDTRVFTQHYDRYANAPGMPAYSETLATLGVTTINGRVRLDDTAPLAHTRRAIMRPLD